MKCKYQLSDGPCDVPIHEDISSYSGYSHKHSADWCHWASPVEYGPGSSKNIFKKCLICGKFPTENREHILYGGHQFIAEEDGLSIDGVRTSNSSGVVANRRF